MGLDTPVRKTAPDGHEESCDDDRANQRDIFQFWFTRDLKVEYPHNQKNGEYSYNDRTYDAVGRTPSSEHFTNHTDQGSNNDPNEHLRERDFHGYLPADKQQSQSHMHSGHVA